MIVSRYNVTAQWGGGAISLTQAVRARSEDEAKALFLLSPFVGAERYARADWVTASVTLNQELPTMNDNPASVQQDEESKA